MQKEMKIYVVVDYSGYVDRCFYSLIDAFSHRTDLNMDGGCYQVKESVVELQESDGE